jgi:hypothetical protein
MADPWTYVDPYFREALQGVPVFCASQVDS